MDEILRQIEHVLLGTGVFALVPGMLLTSLFSLTVYRKFRKKSELAPFMGETGIGFTDVLAFTGIFGLPLKISRWLYGVHERRVHQRFSIRVVSNPDAILPHATRYDRVVGFLAYWLFRISMNSLIVAMICDALQ